MYCSPSLTYIDIILLMNESAKRIIWGESGTDLEIIIRDDKLVIDPCLLENQTQTDLDSCNYLVLAALVHLCNPEGVSPIPRRLGFKTVAKIIRGQVGTPRLSTWQMQEELQKRLPNVRLVTGMLGYAKDNEESVGQAVVHMLEEGMLPAVMLQKENHAILPIGYSGDKLEVIAWDALSGRGNPRLRRLPTNEDDLWLIAAARFNKGYAYKKPAAPQRIEFG